MKKTRKILALILSAVMISTTFTIIPAYAQEQSRKVYSERFVNQSLSEVESITESISNEPIVSVSTYAQLVDAIESKAANIYILQDIQLSSALEIDYDVSFLASSSEKTIYSAPNCHHIKITESDILIQFDNVILDGQQEKTSVNTGGINIPVCNISIVNPIIQNCRGSAIYSNVIDAESLITIYGGIIRNNVSEIESTIELYSTNVLLYNTIIENNSCSSASGTFAVMPNENEYIMRVDIYDSIIRYNTSYDGGGMLFCNTDVFINDNTEIEYNSARTGGGIYSLDSTIESYAKINNNTAFEFGGGINLYNSSFIMQGGEINNNSALGTLYSYGGGIAISNDYNNSNIDVIINGGILDCNHSYFGGAIGCIYDIGDLSASSVQINGGIISKNGYDLEKTDEDNGLCFAGGGILAESVEITNGTIEQNMCQSFGGGIYAKNFKMSGGLIQDNGFYETGDGDIIVKTIQGGGIYVLNSTEITDGLIYSNMAKNGGGAYIKGSFSIMAPAYIRYNIATENGGGVYFFSENGETNSDLTRIKNNTAQKSGDQCYFR